MLSPPRIQVPFEPCHSTPRKGTGAFVSARRSVGYNALSKVSTNLPLPVPQTSLDIRVIGGQTQGAFAPYQPRNSPRPVRTTQTDIRAAFRPLQHVADRRGTTCNIQEPTKQIWRCAGRITVSRYLTPFSAQRTSSEQCQPCKHCSSQRLSGRVTRNSWSPGFRWYSDLRMR